MVVSIYSFNVYLLGIMDKPDILLANWNIGKNKILDVMELTV